MPRLALKPDSSFFRKIAMGAIGTRAICQDPETHGHEIQELERGSLDTGPNKPYRPIRNAASAAFTPRY